MKEALKFSYFGDKEGTIVHNDKQKFRPPVLHRRMTYDDNHFVAHVIGTIVIFSKSWDGIFVPDREPFSHL